jgi:hypothetical protein
LTNGAGKFIRSQKNSGANGKNVGRKIVPLGDVEFPLDWSHSKMRHRVARLKNKDLPCNAQLHYSFHWLFRMQVFTWEVLPALENPRAGSIDFTWAIKWLADGTVNIHHEAAHLASIVL